MKRRWKVAAARMKETKKRQYSTRRSLEMGEGFFGTGSSVKDTSGDSATADSMVSPSGYLKVQ